MITKFWKQVLGGLVALGVVGSGVAAYDQLRPFPTRIEFKEVAGRSCKNELALLMGERRDIIRQRQKAEASGNNAWYQSLTEQLVDVTTEIERVKAECGWS